MRVGIVGSRRRTDRDTVVLIVAGLKADDVVVSGGCRGVDTWAVEEAKKRGLVTLVFLPDLSGTNTVYEKTERYYERNKKIAENSDVLYALVARDRRGGTESTIRYAREFGVKVVVKEDWNAEERREKRHV